MKFKFLLTYLTLGVIIANTSLSNINVVFADSNDNEITVEVENTEEVENNNLMSILYDNDTLDTQIDNLYTEVGNAVGISPSYVKILHLIAGGNSIYADKIPNIYSDCTISTMRAPMEIDGANTEWKVFEQAQCLDISIERPNKYFLPDAMYTVAYDVNELMKQRYIVDREEKQDYFNALKDTVKSNIVFCESVLLYMGESEEVVNSFHSVYEDMLREKDKHEYVLEFTDNVLQFKEVFRDILNNYGITDENVIRALSVILSFDSDIAKCSSVNGVSENYVLPYNVNNFTREDLLTAQMSLIGKVKYVWGGGHSGGSLIDGINPVWKDYTDIYNTTGNSQQCIKPSGSWCPEHGLRERDCSFIGPILNNTYEYLSRISNYLDVEEYDDTKFYTLMSRVDYNIQYGVCLDTLNGLDCSGYTSWVYNQVLENNIMSTAVNFSNNPGLIKLSRGTRMLPGDTLGWSSHIVMIVGKVDEVGNVYVTTESTPGVVKFGVVYYNGASGSDIRKAEEIARQANVLLGGLPEDEVVRCYCIDNLDLNLTEEVEVEKDVEVVNPETGEVTIEKQMVVEEVPVTRETVTIGRMGVPFNDEEIVIEQTGKKLKDMYATEIIQYVLNKYTVDYISGIDVYSGDLFNTSNIK